MTRTDTLPALGHGSAQLNSLISETLGALTRAPWTMPLPRPLGLDERRLLVVGRECVAQIARDLLGRWGTQIDWMRAEEVDASLRQGTTAHALLMDGHAWERGDVPAQFLTQWQRTKRPYIVMLLSSQMAQRGLWLESGALDVFASPAPVRRFTQRLVEAVSGRKSPYPRRAAELEARLFREGRAATATVLELSPEDLLVSSAQPVPAGKVIQLGFALADGTTLEVYARSLFCRSYVSQRALDEGRTPRHVMGLRMVGLTRDECLALERM